MRRLRSPGQPAPPVREDIAMMLLLGLDAPGVGAIPRLQFTSDIRRAAALWREHRDYLLRFAEQRGIQRPPDPDVGTPSYFGEHAVAMAERCPERWGG